MARTGPLRTIQKGKRSMSIVILVAALPVMALAPVLSMALPFVSL
jgi:hypothetical protein